MAKDDYRTKKQYKKYIHYSSLGFQMLATIVLGVLLGNYVDEKYQGEGLWLALISVLFVILAIYSGIKDLIKK